MVWPRPLYERRTLDGQVLDTIWGSRAYIEECLPADRRYLSGFRDDLRSVYLPKVIWNWSPAGRLIIGCAASYEFDLHQATGNVLRVMRTDWHSVEISRTEREEFRTWIDRAGSLSNDPPMDWTDFEIPEAKPPYQAILVAEDGAIWVVLAHESQRVIAPEEFGPHFPEAYWKPAHGGVAHVYTADGRFRGAVQLPDNIAFGFFDPPSPPPVIRGDTVWAVTRRDDGVHHVTRFLVAR